MNKDQPTAYHNKHKCLACGGENTIVTKDFTDQVISECETTCTLCQNKDYWAYGFFQNEKQNKFYPSNMHDKPLPDVNWTDKAIIDYINLYSTLQHEQYLPLAFQVDNNGPDTAEITNNSTVRRFKLIK